MRTPIAIIQGSHYYRAWAKLLNAPLSSSLDFFIAFIIHTQIQAIRDTEYLSYLTVISFAVNRLLVLINKLDYVFVSVGTAMKNKKQRFQGQIICFILQFTFFLPVTLGVILITTLLDTATVPFLGFAFFIIGYPKPLRGWSSVNPAAANPLDERSDGHLYQAMMPQLSNEIQRMISCDPFHFGIGKYYLLKNEKMIILL